MKKIILSFVFLLAGLACSTNVLATVDLQPLSFNYIDNSQTGNYPPTGLYLKIQNNGSERFEGTFLITMYTSNGVITVSFDGAIASESFSDVYLAQSAKEVYSVVIDTNDDVAESNELNNDLSYEYNKPQVKIVTFNGINAQNYRDTLFVLPNEYFYQQFSLVEMNNKKAIIGFDFKAYDNGLSRSGSYYFVEIQSRWPDGVYQNGEVFNGKYNYEFGSLQNAYITSSKWMANTSDAALNYWWIGSFSGIAKNMSPGTEYNIYMNVNYATTALKNEYTSIYKTIKVIDRLRGDVNDDGVVDETDVDILTKVVSNGLYNPCTSFKNLYTNRGTNYGAGIVLFNQPDFVSTCLINIWINNNNDPLVQGLGIGEPMSKINQVSAVTPIANSYEVSGENLIISAPEADLYNVTAQVDGKLYQVTGKIGEKINVPEGATNLRVETVKVKGNITALTTPKSEIKASVYPTVVTDYVNIKSENEAKVKIVNLSGQIIYSSPLQSNETLNVDSRNWLKGIYLINISSEAGNKIVKVIK